MESKYLQNIIAGIIITVVAAVIINEVIPSKQGYIPNPPAIPNYNIDSLKEYNRAYSSAQKITTILQKIKTKNISTNEEINITAELRDNLVIVETYYRRTNNCEIGLVLKDVLSYIIELNKDKINNDKGNKYYQFNELLKDIEKKCGDN
ncbi:MAG: hypothetical protein Q8N83_00030 [Ignavibacteria bacterium]|nr:hypothetical protein [Ignavibacteria bacterium]